MSCRPILFFVLACVTVGFSLAGGCAAIQKPTVSLRNVAVRNVDAEGINIDFQTDVANPNAFSIPVTSATYGVDLSGVKVVDGTVKPEASIAANSSTSVTLPIRLTFDRLVAAEQALAKGGGNVPYTFDGELGFGAGKIPLGNAIKVPLHFNGTLPLRDALKDPALLRSPAAQKLVQSIFGQKLGDFIKDLQGSR